MTPEELAELLTGDRTPAFGPAREALLSGWFFQLFLDVTASTVLLPPLRPARPARPGGPGPGPGVVRGGELSTRTQAAAVSAARDCSGTSGLRVVRR
ncbi:hypothetical protein KCH_14680 [Kitasatospora cheerisanensis KCTC 2395]|uniref:Uncharacterized protein n=1 Tax=Kitasatospora cheerisanensis KCTC 2395 TaxID=1348663 RepID=A0A066YZ66_9ACTN|nr:hypothetical protein KCH_14680 [Kitasatospora cheerisanensis KCTC 2395]